MIYYRFNKTSFLFSNIYNLSKGTNCIQFAPCNINQIKNIMQFIDFKKEHFKEDEDSKDFVIEISKAEIGFGEISVKERKDDDVYHDADYEITEEAVKVIIRMKKPADIRVNF